MSEKPAGAGEPTGARGAAEAPGSGAGVPGSGAGAGVPESEEALLARARGWLAEDPDPQTREELAKLVEARATDELRDRFSGTLQFGTAGLRGELGAGPMRMNRAVVIRAAAGIAAYLRAEAAQGAGAAAQGAEPLVVIGYDARHKSADFARDTAAVMVGAGLRAAMLPAPLPTPVLAFAVRHLGAAAGVMVTASHNPPRDNGYKVYLGDGLQIVPPADGDIAARIAAVGPLDGVPRAESGWQVLGDEVLDAYLARTGAVLTEGSPRQVRVVHTAMHGVGHRTARLAFERAGFPTPVPVEEQAEPDPDFSTVAFPNPEEPGALDRARATARAWEAEHGERPDLIIANDPDADRCGVAVPDAAAEGGWRMLRGDQVGALLATQLIRKRAKGTFATTIVSSSLLSKIAAAAGLPYAETLTGFKWLARVDGLRYGYEEALGYCVDPEGVRDKDGITAALLVAELAAELKQAGRTLAGLLDELDVEYGVHATDQLSVRVSDLSLISSAMERLRAQPPTALGGLAVERTDDLSAGSESLPPTDGLRYLLAGADAAGGPVAGGRVVVRPSGTEPKLKCYLEVVVPVDGAAGLPPARERAARVLNLFKDDLREATGL
ncbi:phospho-sugar mutase [Streptomyces albus subsp. chlorinus]|uniref:phospho-sugar mutase n=1 Tax=Streptomyces albus TaxID=1888 RepID=UPI001570227E|nr:phospho-sugar mutase [Streptomyces albus]NSC23565.1 phospho-sugar mutase [Streptomyces albus subsp. chlorinus]